MRPGAGDQARPAAGASGSAPSGPGDGAAAPGSADGLVVLAVDDEAPALDEISYLLRGDPRVGTILTAGNAAQALALLTRTDGDLPMPDAVLLDIAMPGWDGVDLARVLSGLARPPVVAFLSAHDNRAVEAYEIGAVDYLLKPVRAARLAEAVTRFCAARDASVRADRRAGDGRRSVDRPDGPDRSAAPAGGRPGPAGGAGPRGDDVMIAVDLAGSTRFVPRSAVCWAEAQGDYARLHVAGGGSHLIRTPLAVLQEEWAPAGFVRVHRGYLVALSRIVELRSVDGGYRILVSGQPAVADLPVSRRHLRTLKQQLLAGRRPGR
ncbi:LytR/AlgR family response regulator transcription factor [Nakamurella sp.]|uniref:LytR/AlgR family response regulator transcription factor n=1 Tax=Nakamurella sp. TaxID=1869182 RepID=UPI003B3B6031